MINNSKSQQDIRKTSIGYWASQEQYSMISNQSSTLPEVQPDSKEGV
jgi:hypothetical protein